MTKKEELVEKANGLGIETEGLTIAQLEQAIADKEDEVGGNADAVNAEAVDTAGEESVTKEEVAEESESLLKIDVGPLCNDNSVKIIADCVNGARPDARKRLEDLVRLCIKF